MNSSAPFGSAIASLACAALVACATAEPPNPEPVRTPPPRAYEKTIHNYLAFKVRPPKNAEINVGQPEPGACPLDGQLSSARGWVVPVAYATRTGEPTGRQVVYITSKQYYFWFLGDTIAGVTPRIELCPGLVATFSEGARPASAALPEPSITAPTAASKADAQRRDSAAG